ncbi:hypothetical protein HOP50_16g78760 [Chloropicon primus]|uniref:BAR domain-containing protein n=1 Tax=Chloropicon primus TaxID=1764295 RepID=A0A5B8MWX5_9CHLO|nr:hypothetical protein A3770_16p78460 [Chloropicon primus]UPR04534.1 hypothetical protein HOP50_16g78760 [Chloropicon primus]|eukprot:QDZ25328.1 hypothetical protein A3770_16p78460 [Chloropicon primus]
MSSTKRKSLVLSGQHAARAQRGSIMLTPQQRLANFKQSVTTANATVTETSQRASQNVKKKLEKRRRRNINAQNLLQQLGDMSGINDANLLYGEKPHLGSDTASMMMANTSYLKDSSTAVAEDQVKPKKDLRYKLKSFKRRAEQKVLETFGKSPQRKAKETEFDTMWYKVSKQEQIWKELKVLCKKLQDSMHEIGSIGSEISELLVELCKEEDDDEHSEPQVSTLPLLKLQYSLDTISKDTIPRVIDNQLQESAVEPIKEWRDDFPAYQSCLQKRDCLARDVDAYERKLVTLEDKAIDRRDPAEIARRKDQLARAERRFKSFNTVMTNHLRDVDSQKYEKGQIVGDGILQAFRLWHETCSQLLPPSYTFDSMRNTPKKDSMSSEASLPTPPAVHVQVEKGLSLDSEMSEY